MILVRRKDVPLIDQRYLYTGEDTSTFKNGESYRVVATGDHWIKEYGFVVWMTTEEDKDTNDIDFCCSLDLTYFKKNFWK